MQVQDGVYLSTKDGGQRVCFIQAQNQNLWWVQESSLAATGPEDAWRRQLADDFVLALEDALGYLADGGFIFLGGSPLASQIRASHFPDPNT